MPHAFKWVQAALPWSQTSSKVEHLEQDAKETHKVQKDFLKSFSRCVEQPYITCSCQRFDQIQAQSTKREQTLIWLFTMYCLLLPFLGSLKLFISLFFTILYILYNMWMYIYATNLIWSSECSTSKPFVRFSHTIH